MEVLIDRAKRVKKMATSVKSVLDRATTALTDDDTKSKQTYPSIIDFYS